MNDDKLDLDFLNDIRNSANNFKEKIEIQKLDNCPKRSSFLIEDGMCLGCNYNLNYDHLGEVLGERSFFTIRENYWNSLATFEQENFKLFRDDSRFMHYMNKIRLRYNDLIEFFYSEVSIGHKNREVFLYELSQIVVEMMNNGVNEADIWRPVQQLDGGTESHSLSLYEKINTIIDECKREMLESTRETSFLNHKFFGRLKVSTILMFVMTSLLVLSIALATLSYREFFL